MNDDRLSDLHDGVNACIRDAIRSRRSQTAEPCGRGTDRYDDDCAREESNLKHLLEARRLIEMAIGSYDK